MHVPLILLDSLLWPVFTPDWSSASADILPALNPWSGSQQIHHGLATNELIRGHSRRADPPQRSGPSLLHFNGANLLQIHGEGRPAFLNN